VCVSIRDVNLGLFQKSIIVLKKSFFFRLSNLGMEFGHRSPWVVGRSKTCWDAVTGAGTVVACPPGVALPLATVTAGNNPGSRIGQVLHVLVIS